MKMKSKTIYREEYMNKLKVYKDKKIIKVLTGIRRCGKSTILNEFRNELIKNGVSKENIISINFDDNSNKELLDSQKLHDYILNKTDESISLKYNEDYYLSSKGNIKDIYVKIVPKTRPGFDLLKL